MTNEEFKELWYNDELESMEKDIDDSWRHGNYVYEVFKHGDKYYACNYQVSGDGEYHGIREDDFTLTEVKPITETITVTKYINLDSGEKVDTSNQT